jgi:hypothetical protein
VAEIVYILGAGCSRECGYPLASEVATTLRDFARECLTSADSARIKQAVEQTVALMSDSVDTVDELVRRIDQGHYDESPGFVMGDALLERQRVRHERIENAVIAISALFVHLEGRVAKRGLRRYQEFLNELFPDSSSHWPPTQHADSRHVITFNYDRIFEAAFRERFNFDTQQFGLYGGLGLNSGLDVVYNREVKFSEDRFSFLKLHGSVGMWAVDDLNDVCHQYALPRINQPQEIKDEMFYQKNGADDKKPRRTVFPLLFFPHQRHFVLAQDNAYHFKAYARAVWTRAEKVISNASQIRVIGYSFSGIDRKPFLDVLRKANRCDRIVIQSPNNAEELCARLGSSNADLRPILEAASFAF